MHFWNSCIYFSALFSVVIKTVSNSMEENPYEKLIDAQLVSIFPEFYGNRVFIAACRLRPTPYTGPD
jgi:hypothetical protein